MSRLKSVALSLVLVFSAYSNAGAQNFIEKAFVSKSKLSSKIWTRHSPGSNIAVDHSGWDSFLAKYVSTDSKGINRLAYGSVTSADRQALRSYLDLLQSTDVTSLNRNEQYAFWFNLYNASMVNLNLSHFPIKSVFDIKKNVLDVKGPFNDVVAKVNGKDLTLDTIESGIVRPIWNDPRLHYAFNCAAVSCPNLGKKAYRGATVNAQLDAAAASYVNDPRGVRINGGKVTASKIYFWYQEDFGKTERDVLEHIKQYANADVKAKLAGQKSIANYEYDWALNSR